MQDFRSQGFDSFLERHKKDLARIARASRGDSKPDDVLNEAWLLAHDMGEKRGRALDLDDAEDASLLLRYLYNHCVKFTETVVRHAHRLDHAAAGDEEREHHWLMDRLTADGGSHPLSVLEDMESQASERDDLDPYHSPAAGWIRLIQRFNQRMTAVAEFLLISPSWCYSCWRVAHHMARTQWPLPAGIDAFDRDASIRPWRKFKLPTASSIDMRQFVLNLPTPLPMQGRFW